LIEVLIVSIDLQDKKQLEESIEKHKQAVKELIEVYTFECTFDAKLLDKIFKYIVFDVPSISQLKVTTHAFSELSWIII